MDPRVHLALAASALCFGAFPVLGKIALAELPPFALAQLRIAAGALLFHLLRGRARGLDRLGPRDGLRVALAALFGVVLNQGLFLLGLSRTTAIHTVLLVGTIPAFTFVAGIVARQERPSGWKAGGIALAFAGAAVLLGGSAGHARSGAPSPSLAGDLLVTANCVSYSIYLVLAKPLMRRYEPLSVVAWLFTGGALLFLPIGARALATLSWGIISAKAWAAFAWVVLFPTVAAYWLSLWALRRAEASLVAAYVLLQPLVTAVLAVPILGEVPGWPAAVAAVAIFGGITMVARAGAAGSPS
jgi:drug/metabolite transporter (DMT)-like permease